MSAESNRGRRELEGRRELARGGLRLHSEREQNCHLVALEGELDLACVDLLEEEMARVFAADAPAIVLDLSELRFIDSAGIRLLLQLQTRSSGNGSRLRMLRAGPQVQRLLELTGADRMLPFLGVEPPPSASA